MLKQPAGSHTSNKRQTTAIQIHTGGSITLCHTNAKVDRAESPDIPYAPPYHLVTGLQASPCDSL